MKSLFGELSPLFLPVLTLKSFILLCLEKIKIYSIIFYLHLLVKNVEDSCFNVEIDPISIKAVLRVWKIYY